MYRYLKNLNKIAIIINFLAFFLSLLEKFSLPDPDPCKTKYRMAHAIAHTPLAKLSIATTQPYRLSCRTFLMATISPVSQSLAWYTTPKLPFPITLKKGRRKVSVSTTYCSRNVILEMENALTNNKNICDRIINEGATTNKNLPIMQYFVFPAHK